LAAMVFGHRQDVMVPDHREIGEAEDPADIGGAEHLPERFLDAFLHLSDLATEGGEPAAGGIQDLTAVVEAPFDGHNETRKLPDALPESAQPRELVADPGEPAIEVADGAEGLDRLG